MLLTCPRRLVFEALAPLAATQSPLLMEPGENGPYRGRGHISGKEPPHLDGGEPTPFVSQDVHDRAL